MRLQIRTSQAVRLLAAATMVGALLTSSFLLWTLRERELAHARAETLSLAAMFIEETRQSLQGADKVLQGVQERLGTGFGSTISLDSDMTQLLLATRVAGMRQLHALRLVDARGQVVNASLPLVAQERNVSDQAYFKAFSGSPRTGFFWTNRAWMPAAACGWCAWHGAWTVRTAAFAVWWWPMWMRPALRPCLCKRTWTMCVRSRSTVSTVR